MNLLLLNDHQFISPTSAYADIRQSKHIRTVLNLKVGQSISLGKLNGNMGHGLITERNDNDGRILIENIELDTPPPSLLPLTLILAMPRPQMLKRIMQTVATMGVERLCLLQTSRVEKSFWQSPSATDEAIREHLLLGLEQAMATQLPIVEKHLRFRPFAEDHLADISHGSQKIIAHPGTATACSAAHKDSHVTLAIGPEGGFIEKEVDYFIEQGFSSVHLGRRILKVETAVPVLLATLFPYG